MPAAVLSHEQTLGVRRRSSFPTTYLGWTLFIPYTILFNTCLDESECIHGESDPPTQNLSNSLQMWEVKAGSVRDLESSVDTQTTREYSVFVIIISESNIWNSVPVNHTLALRASYRASMQLKFLLWEMNITGQYKGQVWVGSSKNSCCWLQLSRCLHQVDSRERKVLSLWVWC